MKKALIFVGTRPEAIKLIPVYKELKKKKGWSTILVSTGQHREMLRPIFSFFEVQPDVDLNLMTANQSLESLTSILLTGCSTQIKQHSPDVVIVQGDTTTAMAAGLASYYLKTKLAHVEAGLRSGDINAPFPEEVNRRIITLFTDFHFAPTTNAANAIRKEQVQGKIFNVGNTVIDSLLYAKRKVQKNISLYRNEFSHFDFSNSVLITGHRRENFGEGFLNICHAIKDLATKYTDRSFIYPVHLNPNVKTIVHQMLSNIPNVHLIEPVSYDRMAFLMMNASIILTDSGGIQEEAPTLGKPVVVMREKTERPEGVKAGCSVLAGTSRKKIVKLVSTLLVDKKVYAKMSKAVNPYGKGDSSKKIAAVLSRVVN